MAKTPGFLHGILRRRHHGNNTDQLGGSPVGPGPRPSTRPLYLEDIAAAAVAAARAQGDSVLQRRLRGDGNQVPGCLRDSGYHSHTGPLVFEDGSADAAATASANQRRQPQKRSVLAKSVTFDSMSPVEDKSVPDRHSISEPSGLRRFPGLRRDTDHGLPLSGFRKPCARPSLPACVATVPRARPTGGLTWLAGRFGKRAQSDPWISDRIRRYFLNRRFTVGTNANALLLSAVGGVLPCHSIVACRSGI